MDPEVFLDLYNNLETKLKGRGSYYNDRYESPIIRFSNSSEGKPYREELSTIRDIRNLLVHSPLVNGKYPVEPSDEIGAVLEEILEKVEQPKKAMNYATWADKIQKTRLDEEAYPVMRMMELRGFSHVPVVEGEKMIGVFSKSTVFSFHIRNNMPALQRGMRIKEFGNLLDIENHSNEYFEFAPKDALYTDILELFNTNYKKRQKRLAIVFLTETGNSQEKLLGLITPWDVLGK